jgi:hypothetical protein
MIPMIAQKLLDETAHAVDFRAGHNSAVKAQDTNPFDFLGVDGQLHDDYLL